MQNTNSVDLAHQLSSRNKNQIIHKEPLSPSNGSKDPSPIPGQAGQQIPLKSSRNKDVQRSLDSRR